jgi:lipopolysaccharide O-acetyltransferase
MKSYSASAMRAEQAPRDVLAARAAAATPSHNTSRLLEIAREDGWMLALTRAARSLVWRMRDALIARRLGAPGFRAGRAPRVAGLRHMRIGRDLHAADALWMEAVTAYGEQRFTPQLIIGAGARLSDRVHIACVRRIEIGPGLLTGSSVLISDHTHGVYHGPEQSDPYPEQSDPYPEQSDPHGPEQSDPAVAPAERLLHSESEVIIGRNVWLGDSVAVLAGARIGDGAVIGANSVVTGHIPAETIAVGAPARVVRRWDRTQRAWTPVGPQ